MGGPISSILDISRRSLNNTSQAIRVVGNNIANANNDSYSAREVLLKDRASNDPSESSFGLGADIDKTVRRVDEFVNRMHRDTVSDSQKAGIRSDLLSRAEGPFGVDRTLRTIGSELGEYFGALQSLELSPADQALRSNFITAGQNLASGIRLTMETLSSLQREADDRIRISVDEVNSLSKQIAAVNLQIQSSESGVQENLGLRDERDRLLRALSEKISYNTVEDSNGAVTVYLANGFSLVSGTSSTDISVTSAPSFGAFPPALDGGAMGTIVWDADDTAGFSHVNLEALIAGGTGELAGLLQVRGVPQTTDTNPFQALGDLPEIASRVEAITRNLLEAHNNIYRPLDGGLVASARPDGTQPGYLGLFSVPSMVDANASGFVDLADFNAAGISNFSSFLSFVPQQPEDLALAADENPAAAAVAFSPGNGGIARALFAQRTIPQLFAAGNFSQNSGIEDVYTDAVTFVGTKVARAKAEVTTTANKEEQLNELRTSASGVNLDEQLAKLISLQRSFQASSRMIKVGDELLQTILSAVGA